MNGQTTIDINGQQVGLTFGFPQAKDFAIATAENLEHFFDGDQITNLGIAKLLHTAYKNDCLLENKKPVLTYREFAAYIEGINETGIKQLTAVLEEWQASKYTKLWVDEIKKKTAEIEMAAKSQQKIRKGSTKKLKPSSMQTVSEDQS